MIGNSLFKYFYLSLQKQTRYYEIKIHFDIYSYNY